MAAGSTRIHDLTMRAPSLNRTASEGRSSDRPRVVGAQYSGLTARRHHNGGSSTRSPSESAGPALARTSVSKLPPTRVWPLVLGVVALFGIVVLVVWQTGLLDKKTPASNTQLVVAMLTLLGGLVASSFTLVGVLLKHSIDRRSASLAGEAEARLKLETAIKAVELLTMPDGASAPGERQAGALFVLASAPLQQLDLALALLSEHWGSGAISSSAAIWVIDRALREPDPQMQSQAAWILRSHLKEVARPDSQDLHWPPYVGLDAGWPAADIAYAARVQLVWALALALSLDYR